jgi:pimeloyl-ACP methyl ester carboxylesterase
MQASRLVYFVFAVALSSTCVTAGAAEVTLRHKGMALNADFELAPGKTVADGVVLITHGGLAHRDMDSLTYLRSVFKEQGYSTLAINLSLGLDNRHGMYDCKVTHRHRNDDAADEIGVWVNWLKEQGVTNVTLLGHSRGGAQTALYAAERDDAVVRAVVLMAPATRDNGDLGYEQRYGEPLMPMLDKAQRLVNDGKGDTVLEHANIMFCRDTSATANAFVSYYAPDPRLDTPSLLPRIDKPTLVVVAGDDEVVVGLEKKIAQLVDGKHVRMKIVETADHLFRDLYSDDAVEAIDAFLKTVDNPGKG